MADKSELLKEFVKAQEEHNTLTIDVRKLEQEVSRLEEETIKSDTACLEMRELCEERMKTAFILNVFSHLSRKKIAQNMETINKLQSYISKTSGKQRLDQSILSHSERLVEPRRDINSVCECIESLLMEDVIAKLSQENGENITRNNIKEKTWNQVESMMSQFTADEIIDALITYTNHMTTVLEQETNHIDIRKDVRNLGFEIRNDDSASGISEQMPPQLRMRKLLQKGQLMHMKLYFNSLKYKSKEAQFVRELRCNKEQIANQVQLIDLPGERELAHKVIEASLQLSEERAAIKTLHEDIERLGNLVVKSKLEQNDLISKRLQINNFRELVHKKQEVIKYLAHRNSKSPSFIEAHQNEVKNTLVESLMRPNMELENLLQSQKNVISKEVEKFTKLPFQFLSSSVVASEKKLTYLDLSINLPPVSQSFPYSDMYREISHLLDLPLYKGNECILELCATLKRDINAKRNHDNNYAEELELLLQKLPTKATTEGLQRKLEDMRHSEEERLIPKLSSEHRKAADALTNCISSKECVKDWWEQPGQFSAPWVRGATKTLKELQVQWLVHVTSLRSKSPPKQ